MKIRSLQLLFLSYIYYPTDSARCPVACGVCPPPGFDGACCHGNVTCETQNWSKKTCTPAYGTWCERNPTPTPPPTPPPPPTPAPPPTPSVPHVRWVGGNLAGFDYGNLARASGTWCTDEYCDSGGWSDPRISKDKNCPGYGGNKQQTYTPAKICNGVVDVPNHYNGGFGTPKDFIGSNYGVGASATSVAIPVYARASPIIDEVKGMLQFGMNTFRVPFRIEYVHELWEGTWMRKQNLTEYIPPHPHYLQMVVDFMEKVLSQKAPAGAPPISVIFDMHAYMRWCPMGIGGTFSCLAESGYDGPIKYSEDPLTSCPLSSVFPDHSKDENICPKNPTEAMKQHYWDSAPKFQNYTGTPNYNMHDTSPWTCPLDEMENVPSESRWSTCGDNNHSPPTSEKQNSYSKILTQNCFMRIWEKLLNVPVSSLAFPGQCTPLYRVLNHYSNEGENSILIGLMNEPTMVDTSDLAFAYKQVITMMRSKFGLRNRLLVDGNYWAGLHAQVTPEDRSQQECGAPSSTHEGHTSSGKMPIEVIYDQLKTISNLGNWSYDVHQYFDYDSTGNWDCGENWPESACANGTIDQVKQFVNWEKFITYCKQNDISVTVTEFGGHPTTRCSNWIKSFLQILQDDQYQPGKGGVLLWSIWRVCPHSSWFAAINPDDPSADCIQFAAPQDFDPENYRKLWDVTSSNSVKNGMKHAMSNFVYV